MSGATMLPLKFIERIIVALLVMDDETARLWHGRIDPARCSEPLHRLLMQAHLLMPPGVVVLADWVEAVRRLDDPLAESAVDYLVALVAAEGGIKEQISLSELESELALRSFDN